MLAILNICLAAIRNTFLIYCFTVLRNRIALIRMRLSVVEENCLPQAVGMVMLRLLRWGPGPDTDLGTGFFGFGLADLYKGLLFMEREKRKILWLPPC